MSNDKSEITKIIERQMEKPDQKALREEFEKKQREIFDLFRPKQMDINSHLERTAQEQTHQPIPENKRGV